MATVKSECFAFPSCLLEVIQTNEDPNSYENSCTDPHRLDNPQNQCSSSFLRQILRDEVGVPVVIRVVFLVVQATIKRIQSFPFTAFLVVKVKSRKNFERGSETDFSPTIGHRVCSLHFPGKRKIRNVRYIFLGTRIRNGLMNLQARSSCFLISKGWGTDKLIQKLPQQK